MRQTIDHIDLPARPTSVAAARRFVERTLRRLGISSREVGTLLTSELVTNAVLYSDGTITVTVTPTDDDGVRVSVKDDSPRPVRPRDVGIDATSGRGIALVKRLSRAWGVDDLETGKVVWFELGR